MTRQTKVYLGAAGAALAYVVAALIAGWMLHLKGGDLWTLRLGLTVLGLVTAALIIWFFRDRQAAAPSSPDAHLTADVASLVVTARQHLAAAKAAGGKAVDTRFGALPAVLVLGSPSSAKTTAVVRSGLEPELLAGEVFRGETVAPTRSANLWYGHGTIFAEAASTLTASRQA